MSLIFYAKEEDYGKEESVNLYKSLFSSYKNLNPNLSDALNQMFKSENLDDKKCNELTKDLLDKCINKIDPKLAEIKKKYKNISKDDAYIICSYTCESKDNIYSPYKILNKNLVSENRKNGIRNISKYLYIFLKSLRKLPRYYPPKNINYLYRCITQKVKLDKDSFNDKLVPYKIGEKKTFWGFTSTSINPKTTYNFLKDEKDFKSGTIFSLEGDIWGYDIELFNYFYEKEILLEPERKFIVKNVLPPINEIINITCQILESPLILLDNEIDQNNIIIDEIDDKNNNYNGKIDGSDIKDFKIIQKIELLKKQFDYPYHENNKKLLNDKQKEKGKLEQNEISENLPDVHVIKWVDYSSKYGFGYILSNGHIGAYFNDCTKIIYNPNGENFIYIERYTKEKGEIINEHKFNENLDKDLNKKVIILEHFKSKLFEEKTNLPKEKNVSKNIDIYNYVYVKRVNKIEKAILSIASNKLMQASFFDKTKIIIDGKIGLAFYIDNKNQIISYPIQTALDCENSNIKKKLIYAKESFECMLNKKDKILEK